MNNYLKKLFRNAHWLFYLLLILPTCPIQAADWIYTTRPGDTLWDISKTYLKSVTYWNRLQQYNKVARPKHLSPGTRLKVPVSWLKNQPQPAVVSQVTGTVTVTDANTHQTISVLAGSELSIGSTLKTGKNSSATIQFNDGSRSILRENSTLVLDTLSVFGSKGMVDTHLRLQQGRIETKVVPLRKRSERFQITSPAAVAAVRGTGFRINATSTGETAMMRSEVLEGSVDITGAKKTQNVPAGYGTLTKAGKPPMKPRALLDAPDFTEWPSSYSSLPLEFSWPSINQAVDYRVQVSADRNFNSLIFEKISLQPIVKFDSFSDGNFWLRVRGRDDWGLEGRDATYEFRFDLAFPPPQVNVPQNPVFLVASEKLLSWQAVDGVSQYRIQLSPDEEFSELIVDEVVDKLSIAIPLTLTPQRYYWRVSSRNARAEDSPFGTMQQFDIVLPPPSPQYMVQVFPNTVQVQVRAIPDIHRYHLQIALDPGFHQIIEQAQLQKPFWQTTGLPYGQYFIRIWAVDKYNHSSPFHAQQFEVPKPLWWPFALTILVPILL